MRGGPMIKLIKTLKIEITKIKELTVKEIQQSAITIDKASDRLYELKLIELDIEIINKLKTNINKMNSSLEKMLKEECNVKSLTIDDSIDEIAKASKEKYTLNNMIQTKAALIQLADKELILYLDKIDEDLAVFQKSL